MAKQKQQALTGQGAEDAMDDEEFEQFDAEGDELLADDSDDDDSMQVVSMHKPGCSAKVTNRG
jgi:nuclear GTP-binding protein